MIDGQANTPTSYVDWGGFISNTRPDKKFQSYIQFPVDLFWKQDKLLDASDQKFIQVIYSDREWNMIEITVGADKNGTENSFIWDESYSF